MHTPSCDSNCSSNRLVHNENAQHQYDRRKCISFIIFVLLRMCARAHTQPCACLCVAQSRLIFIQVCVVVVVVVLIVICFTCIFRSTYTHTHMQCTYLLLQCSIRGGKLSGAQRFYGGSGGKRFGNATRRSPLL